MKTTVFSLILLLTAAACSRRPSDPHAEFNRFVDAYFELYFNFHPSEATAAGLHDYDSRLENWTENAITRRVADLRKQSETLESLLGRNLSSDDRIDAQILSGRVNAELLDLDTLRLWRRNPLLYAGIPGSAVDGLMKRSFAPGPQRVRSVVERMRNIPPLLEGMRNNVGECPREFVELALRVVRGSVGFFQRSVPEWAKVASNGDERLLAELGSANRRVLESLVMAAEFLERDLLPAANASYGIGADAYARKLEFEELIDTPVAQLLSIGQATLDRDRQAFVDTARRIDPSRSPAEVMQILSLQHPSEGELTNSASATSERIRGFVAEKKIIPIPSEVRPAIVPTPPYARAGSFASMDTPGPYEKSAREAFYYVTPVEPDWTPAHKEEHLRLFNKPVMELITIHEAWPGHYVQFLYASQFPTKTRKLIACGSNAEGWAHYAEQMMVEQGFGGGDPKIRLAQLSEALVRDVRLIAGIKLHTQGMSVEEAQQVFMRDAFMEQANALEEARRGTYNPTYLYYTVGKLQIYKLRDDYAKRKGSAFSLGEFHREFVRQGAIPIRLIRRIMLEGDNSPSL